MERFETISSPVGHPSDAAALNERHYETGASYEVSVPDVAANARELRSPGEAYPLVTVVVRSMDRNVLGDALESVAAQTWPNIEVVVVNAKGGVHRPLETLRFRFPISVVGDGHALGRAAAANAGLLAARGRFLVFLDDDDLLLPEHIEKLGRLLMEGGVRAAYSGVRMVDAEGNLLAFFDEAWEPARLRGANFLPIHGVMFERSLVEEGCRFDEGLECLEDWDFWLQVAQRTGFRHAPGITAVYRYGLGESALSTRPDMELHLETRARMFEKWSSRFSARQWVESIFWFESALRETRRNAERAEAEMARLRERHQLLDEELASSNARCSVAERSSREMERLLGAAERRVAYLEQAHAMERSRNESLISSTSWKMGAPLRLLVRLVRGQRREVAAAVRVRMQGLARRAYRRIPMSFRGHAREVAYRLGGWWFRGIGHYEAWRRERVGGAALGAGDLAPSTMVRIEDVEPYRGDAPGRIAIQVHVFYGDLADEFAAYFGNMPFPFDLFVSVPDERVKAVCEKAFANVPRRMRVEIAVVPNRGRDIAPMLCTFGEALRGYDFVAHFHSKKSLYNNGATDGWRSYLLQALLGSERQVRQIFALLERHGMVFPQCFHSVPYAANTWLANRHHGATLSARMGLSRVPEGYFDFPVGSMFWARGDALRPLFECGIRLEEFPEEVGQTDGTLAHGIERMLGVLAMNCGDRGAAVIRDVERPSWSAWRFDVYLGRTREMAQDVIGAPDVHLVIFDVFDTLLVRPLLDPEDIKEIVARRVGEHGAAYLRWRAVAERSARDHAGRDVGLDEIFKELSTLSGLDAEVAAMLRRTEVAVEKAVVRARPDTLRLLEFALHEGKRVVLASDTYLTREVVTEMLTEAGIEAWHALYLSSETGERKDTGRLYPLILEREGVRPDEAVVVGDNERSDMQIPCDMGLTSLHVLRAVEMARAVPRLSALIERPRGEQGLERSVALGMVLRQGFKPVFFEDFDPASLFANGDARSLGYGVLGPFVTAFAQWLLDHARADGVDRLYFLAREGQFLKMVYDRLVRGVPDAPRSDYLIVSRRAVNLPAIQSRADFDEIAGTPFGPAGLELFLTERFGLALSNEDYALLTELGLLPRLREVLVRDGNIKELAPLLDALEPRILAVAEREREGMKAYLAEMGLTSGGKAAVVDIGYGATIQKRLIRILGAPLDGYYMMTHQHVAEFETQQGVRALGCFCHRATVGPDIPLVLKESFVAEKLLSSDDPQVVNYRLREDGTVEPTFKVLSARERATVDLRQEVRQAALSFVDEFMAVSEGLSLDIKVPTDLAVELFEGLMASPSDAEREVFAGFSLDDHFCGRGVVS